MIKAQLPEKGNFNLQRREQAGGFVGPQQPHRGGFKGEDDKGQRFGVGQLPGPLNNSLMAHVNAVKVADGEDTAVFRFRKVVQRVKYLHYCRFQKLRVPYFRVR